MAGKGDKNKSAAGKDSNSAAVGENADGLETGSEEALTRTVTKLHELANNMMKETTALSEMVKSNKRATVVNAESIKDVEKFAKDTKTELALTNARMDTMSEKIDTVNERIQFNSKRSLRWWPSQRPQLEYTTISETKLFRQGPQKLQKHSHFQVQK